MGTVLRRLIASVPALVLIVALAPDDFPLPAPAQIHAPTHGFALDFDWTTDAPDFLPPDTIRVERTAVVASLIAAPPAPAAPARTDDVLCVAPKTSPPV